ncbi:MAG: adenosine kinase [Alphaproteobacteria bacterium]|nr:adenosine kinase [Alphaproteobacteria bacterium]
MIGRTPDASRTWQVAGLGNALVDALVRIDDDGILARMELTRGNMHPVDHSRWQAAFEALQHHGVQIQSGGSCANTIATLGLMGVRSIYAGQVGEDQLGHLYAAKMTEACGAHALTFTRELNTGKCLSIISSSDAERTMLTDLGAAVAMPGLGAFEDTVRSAGMLHVTGYLLLGEPMASRCMEAIAIANQEEIPVSIDVADPFVVSTVRDVMWRTVEEFADVVFLNAEEARALTGKSPEEAIHEIGEVCDTVVLKLGGRGSLVKHHDDLFPVGVHPVAAVDTTGAGDAYAAGFLYGYLQGWAPQRAADLGARVASLTVAQLGAVVRDRDALAAAITAAQA